MTTLHRPNVQVPPWWPTRLEAIDAHLRGCLTRAALHSIGVSAGGRDLLVVECPPPHARTRLLVIGGTHGHEPGTVAAAMNLVAIADTGADLAGRWHPELSALLKSAHLYIAPVLNPDGRAVCPDSFVGLTTDACRLYANGLQRDGTLIPYDAGSDDPLYHFALEDAIFVGGQFNGAGIAINRRRTLDPVDAVEVDALLRFVLDHPVDAILDLHACGFNFAFQARSHEAPYWPVMRRWQARAEELFASRGSPLRPLYGDGDPPAPPPFHYNSAVFHQRAHLMWLAFEGRQGFLGHPSYLPQPDHREIVDDYLTAVRVFIELGVEGEYARANKAVFGSCKPLSPP